MLSHPLPAPFPVGQGFGANAQMYKPFGLAGHNGTDYLAPEGTLVLAAHDGVVRFAGDGSASPVMGSAAGTCCLIEDESGTYATGYAHLRNVWVKAGQTVKAGEVIGCVGHTGWTTGSHLHFELTPLPLDLTTPYLGREDPAPYMESAPAEDDAPVEDAHALATDAQAHDE